MKNERKLKHPDTWYYSLLIKSLEIKEAELGPDSYCDYDGEQLNFHFAIKETQNAYAGWVIPRPNNMWELKIGYSEHREANYTMSDRSISMNCLDEGHVCEEIRNWRGTHEKEFGETTFPPHLANKAAWEYQLGEGLTDEAIEGVVKSGDGNALALLKRLVDAYYMSVDLESGRRRDAERYRDLKAEILSGIDCVLENLGVGSGGVFVIEGVAYRIETDALHRWTVKIFNDENPGQDD